MADLMAELLAAIDRRATEDTRPLERARRERTAATNHPFQTPPARPERRAARTTYADPTASRAIGRITKKEKR